MREDIDVARKAVLAASATIDFVDALKKARAFVEGVDYFAVLRTILQDANGMLVAAGVEWDEVEYARAESETNATEAANHA
jgi:hypothetical protein